jgi:hypothetical protein
MPAPAHKLVQSFIREATEDENYQPLTSATEVYAKLREIQRGNFEAITENGTTLIASTVAGKTFQFRVADDLSPAGIIAIAETALQLIEGKTVAQARALLRRRKNTRPDFSGMCAN